MSNTNGLQAEPIRLGQRLGDQVQLYCPLFQRAYVWGQQQINQLWDDIDTVLDEQYQSRFLGALVFDDEQGQTASKAGQYWVIDGQQRLTTMYLTVVALASTAHKWGTDGRIIANDLYRDYLVSTKSDTRFRPRLRPTLRDTHQFNSIMQTALSHEDVMLDLTAQAGDAEGNMTKSYNLIRKKIEERTLFDEIGSALPEPDVVERISRLRDVLLDQLEFVEIRLGDFHDANEVFDRLNKEGMRLGLIDLVRNEVLKRLKDDASMALQLYASEWQSFEENFPNAAAREAYFFPFALTVDSTITKATTFKRLVRHWHDITSDGELSPKQELKEIMADLSRHQPAYNAIDSGIVTAFEKDLHANISRLNALNRPSTLYPYAMQLLTATSAGEAPVGDAVSCLNIIESFLVRRALMGIEPTGLHAIFKKLWAEAGWDPSRVRKSIVSRTVVFPSDEQFSAAVVAGSLYGRKIAPFVLAEYEQEQSKIDVMKNLPKMTIDHVMPQKYNEHWAVSFSPEQHAQWVDTWANLVPLSGPANSSKQDKSWEDSRRLLQAETVFSTTKNIYFRNAEWTPEILASRAAALSEWALARWPFYGELLAPTDEPPKLLG
ncbi:DUF262 domain-containing HNH endonuclease family protein [Sinomonas flava]|uniref:DUF262 domain-containing protein n=1 Tax=Sinomonas flava TaxID=496857 RepID=A0ABP5NIS8_9MICC